MIVAREPVPWNAIPRVASAGGPSASIIVRPHAAHPRSKRRRRWIGARHARSRRLAARRGIWLREFARGAHAQLHQNGARMFDGRGTPRPPRRLRSGLAGLRLGSVHTVSGKESGEFPIFPSGLALKLKLVQGRAFTWHPD